DVGGARRPGRPGRRNRGGAGLAGFLPVHAGGGNPRPGAAAVRCPLGAGESARGRGAHGAGARAGSDPRARGGGGGMRNRSGGGGWTRAFALAATIALAACAAPRTAPAPRPGGAAPTGVRLPPIPPRTGALAIDVVYPAEGQAIGPVDSTFVFGNLGTGQASLSINGVPVEVAPNGAFLAYLPVPPDGVYRVAATAAGGQTVTLERRVQTASLSAPAPGAGSPTGYEILGPDSTAVPAGWLGEVHT